LAVYTHFKVSLFAQLFKQFAVVAFAPPYNRGKQHNSFSGKVLLYMLNYFFFAELYHFFAGVIRVCLTYTGKKQAHKIVHFGNGANGGARVAVGSFLLDRYDGGKAGYFIYVRPVEVANELAGIGCKALHIPALTFGKNGVE